MYRQIILTIEKGKICMKHGRKIVDFNDIESVMLKSGKLDIIQKIADFFKQNPEKYTHDVLMERYFINSFFPSFPSPAWSKLAESLGKIVHGERIPFQVDMVVTGDCHCSCWHCFRAKHDNQELSSEVIKKFMAQASELGTASIGITGGEPMLREDIVDIIQSIPDGMEGQLYTTGYRVDKDFLNSVKGTNLTRVIVSLDHYDENIMCKRRGNDHAFKDALNAIEILSDQNIYTAVTLCITDDLLNEEDIIKYFEFVSKLGGDEIRIILPIPQGNLEGKNYKRLYMNAMHVIKKFKNDHMHKTDFPSIVLFSEYESQHRLGCGAGANYISLNNDGSITPCVAVPLAFGNIYESALSEIYESMGAYFKNSGRTCYGKRIGKIMQEECVDTTITPLPLDVSLSLASKCVVDGEKADFFEKFAK